MSTPLNPQAIVRHIQQIKLESNDFSVVQVPQLLLVFRELYKIVACLGKVFSIALADITEKCDAIEAILKRSALVEDEATVQRLIKLERGTKALEKHPGETATRKLLALVRSLDFVAKLLQELQGSKELSYNVWDSYHASLEKYHSKVVINAVYVATFAVPYKNDFFKQLNLKPTQDPLLYCKELSEEMAALFTGLQKTYAEEKCWDMA